MTPLLFGICSLISAWLIHFIWWRIKLPKRQTKALLIIFLGSLVGSYLFQPLVSYTLAQWISITIFFVGATLAYIITYSAVEVDSPSLLIVRMAAQPGGVTESELLETLNDDVLVSPRIQDLLRDGHTSLQGDKFYLTPKGRRFVGIFIFYRNLLSAEKGG